MRTTSPYPIPVHQLQGWLFDLDGTLMDTDDQAVEALAHRLRMLGDRRSHKLARQLVMATETPANHAMTLLDLVGLDAWVFALRRRISGQVSPTFRLIAGVERLLPHLAERAKLAVVSTRCQRDSAAFLSQHGLSEFISCSATQETTQRLKPHPEPVLYAAAQLGMPPDACVMVGDTTVDIRAARRAGAWAIGVLCGFGEERELWRAGAHMVVRTTADLLTLCDGA
jgi:phosphoglycolate phosphatase-like HAD superfamily hydrolase